MILTATINEVKRRITFDNPQAVVAVKGDYEVNGIAFAFPAIYEDDFDLSTAVKTVYYKATDGIIYNHVVTDTDTDTGYPLWVFKDEINKGAFGDVEFALVCDKVEGGNIVKRWVSMITAFRVQKSIEIDESAQEDNEQTYSERLAYLMTQMANMQVTVSGLASGAPTAVSLASAMTDTSKLYVYTGSESGYTAGHWYYYNGSAWADGGQYGGATIDATLTQSGQAADAKVTGDKIAEIKEDLSDNNSYNIFDAYGRYSGGTSRGATLTWDNNHVGTIARAEAASAATVFGNILGNTNEIPVPLVKGETYILQADITENNVWLQIMEYRGSNATDIYVRGLLKYTVPNDIDGVLFRLLVGKDFSGTTTIRVKMLNAPTNKMIADSIEDLQEQIDGGSGFTSEFVVAFSNFLDHLSGVFDDQNGQTYIDALKNALQSGESSDGIRFSNGALWISETAPVTATQSGSILTLA